jgi:hypothetical protein
LPSSKPAEMRAFYSGANRLRTGKIVIRLRGEFDKPVLMLVKRFQFKRKNDKSAFRWTAQSEMERPGFYRGFHAVGKTLADVCWKKRMQTMWGPGEAR